MSFNKEKKNEIHSELTCTWNGCNNTIIGTDKLISGWKYLVISSGVLFIEDNLLGADIDGVLCPIHALQLRNFLKSENGNTL